jgi:endoglucanase
MYFPTYLAITAAVLTTACARVTCGGKFDPISASTFTAALNPGWNPGNTMDATPDETSWGNPLLVNSTFANVKKLGFNGIRLPGLRFNSQY